VSKRGLYFAALNETPNKVSIDFLDFKRRLRSTLVHLDKPFWIGMTVSPDERSLRFLHGGKQGQQPDAGGQVPIIPHPLPNDDSKERVRQRDTASAGRLASARDVPVT
jgi:hypothetical protein